MAITFADGSVLTAAQLNTLAQLDGAVFTGTVRNTGQPVVIATPSGTDSDITGDGTVATLQWETEITDQGGDFAANTFTAPVTGSYLITGGTRITGIVAGHTTGTINVVTSNRSYNGDVIGDCAAVAGAGGQISFTWAVIADMDAADTCTITLTGVGGTKVWDNSGGDSSSHLSIALIA